MDFADVSDKAVTAPKEIETPKTAPHPGDETFEISSKRGPGLALFICWVAVFISIGGTIFLWLLNNSAAQAITSKTQEKTDIINQISSPTLAETESKATAFKSAVTKLSEINKSRYPMDDFLTKFYARISQNVKITNIALTSDGKISISGNSNSYRAVADQLLLLREWKVNKSNILTDVQLMSVTQGVNEAAKKAEVAFLITGNVDKTKSLIEVAESSATTDSTTTTTETVSDLSTEGGDDAAIQ